MSTNHYHLNDEEDDPMFVENLATEMYAYLLTQDGVTIELADYSSLLRDEYDLRGAQIDEIIEYSVDHNLIVLWREPSTGDMWVSAVLA